jgi:hypothetical protein
MTLWENIEIILNIKNTKLYEQLKNKEECILTLEQFPGWDQDHCFPTFISNNQINPHTEKSTELRFCYQIGNCYL